MNIKNKLMIAVLTLVVVSLVLVPAIPAFSVGQSLQEKSISTQEILMEDEVTVPSQPHQTTASIGTFWWYRNDGGLIYAQGDAEGFAQALMGDGCSWPINKNENYLQDDHLQDGSGELIENVDIGYFVGHSGPIFLGIHKPFPDYKPLQDQDEYADFLRCAWGDDEGSLKWVVLATCMAARGGILTDVKTPTGFQYALQGINMILGWQTVCSDALYGPTFANKITEGETLKQAWFEAAEECEHVHAIAKILAEDSSVGDDYLTGYGSSAEPTVDDHYSFWTHEVAGWQENFDWSAPDYHISSTWQNANLAYDNVDPDYTEVDLLGWPNYDETWSVFDEPYDGWSAPLHLYLNSNAIVRGFRFIANSDKEYDLQTYEEIRHFDQLRLGFYNGGELKTTVILQNWEGGSWRIIDFEGSLYEATLDGETQPIVDRVTIQFHEDQSGKTFADMPAKISEFDFWIVPPTGNGEELEMQSLPLAPLEFGETGFSSIANNLDMSGVMEYVDTATSPQTTKLQDGEELLTYSEQTGMLNYIKPSQAYPIATSEPALPSDGATISMANALFAENGLPAEEFSLKTITYDTQGAGDKYSNEVFYEWNIAKTMYFERQIGGVTLPELAKVTIGLDGTVAAFSMPMFDLQ